MIFVQPFLTTLSLILTLSFYFLSLLLCFCVNTTFSLQINGCIKSCHEKVCSNNTTRLTIDQPLVEDNSYNFDPTAIEKVE